MRIRSIAAITGIAGALVLTQLVGSADAQAADPLAQFEEVIESHTLSNKLLGACVLEKGFDFDGSVEKADIIDAATFIAPNDLTAEVQATVDARIAAAPDDANSAVVAKLTPEQQAAWIDAVNDCGTNVDEKLSGGLEARNKVALSQMAAMTNPKVAAAAQTYVDCMATQSFKVDADPFVASKEIMQAEHGLTDAEINLVEKYNTAWHSCVPAYQAAVDQALATS